MRDVDWPDRLDIAEETWDSLDTEAKLKRMWEDEPDIFGVRIDSWPPTDDLGNEFPMEWIPADDVRVSERTVESGKIESAFLYDNEYRNFKPFAGNREPIPDWLDEYDDRCNARLSNWEERYGEQRFCAVKVHYASNYCQPHKGREELHVNAKEALQHGITSQTRDHYYNKLEPHERLLVHGLHEDLLDESRFDFVKEYDTRSLDFSDTDVDASVFPFVDDDQQGSIEVPYATEHMSRSLALLAAATDTVKEMSINADLLAAGLSTESAAHADHVVPTEDNTVEEPRWSTYEEEVEHPLNLAYSRLIKDKKELLKFGGVPLDGETVNAAEDNPLLDRLQEVDSDLAEADPELVTHGSEMRRQAEAGGGELDLETVEDGENATETADEGEDEGGTDAANANNDG